MQVSASIKRKFVLQNGDVSQGPSNGFGACVENPETESLQAAGREHGATAANQPIWALQARPRVVGGTHLLNTSCNTWAHQCLCVWFPLYLPQNYSHLTSALCRVLVTLYIVFEVSAGLILANAAHTLDKTHSVWTSLFPGQSKLPAALTNTPVFSWTTCEFCVLLVTLGYTVLHSTALILEKGRLQRLRLE